MLRGLRMGIGVFLTVFIAYCLINYKLLEGVLSSFWLLVVVNASLLLPVTGRRTLSTSTSQ